MSPVPDSTSEDPQQIIADLRRELATRTAERDEALEQQRATAEVLGVINSSPGDLAPVFDAMLERATRLCGASSGLMWTTTGDRFQAVAIRGMPTEFVELIRDPANQPRMVASNLPIGRVVRGETLVHVLDLQADDLTHEPPAVKKLVDLGGFRTILALPLRTDAALLGAFVVGRREVRPFTDNQIALLQNFAAQAVIAMENARLITETREALEQQTATAEVLGVINASPGNLAPVFDTLLEKALRLCSGVYGSLLSYDGHLFHVMAVAHENAALADRHRSRLPFQPFANSPLYPIVTGDEVSLVRDLLEHSAYRDGRPEFREMVDAGGYRSHLNVAPRKEGALLGVIAIFCQEVRLFTDKEVSLLKNFAAQAVIAIENARLFGELNERTADLTESLEYQTATSDVLKVISRSTFDPQPVLDTVCETAVRLCSADTGGISTRAGEVYRVTASYAMSPEWYALQPTLSFTPGRDTVVGRTLLERRVVQIADITADPEYALSEAIISAFA